MELDALRWKLLSKTPWIGALTFKMKWQIAETPMGTAFTDGKRIVFDPKALAKWSHSQCLGVAIHELLHNAWGHIERQGNRNRLLWNLATDAVINAAVEEVPNVDLPPGTVTFDWVTPDMTSERVYQRLQKELKDQGYDPDCPVHGDGNGEWATPPPPPGDGDSAGDGDDSGDGGSSVHEHDEDSAEECTCSGHFKDMVDKDPIGRDMGEYAGDPETADEWEVEKREALTNGVRASKDRGTFPASLDKHLKIGEEKIDWEQALARFVSSTVSSRTDYSYRRLNPSLQRKGLRAPGLQVPTTEVVCVLDASGSISDKELSAFMGEVKGAASTGARIHLVQCDVEISEESVETLEPGESLPDDFSRYRIGGTSFEPPLKWAKETHPSAACLVFFTDGYAPEPSLDVKPNYPVLWVTTGKEPASWGMVIDYEP